MGVRRAVDIAHEEARLAGGKPVFTLGPLIHNPKVLNDLKAAGIQAIEELPSSNQCSIIIRAHGISPVIEKDLLDKDYRIVDATCPKVKKNQLKVKELINQGYFLFLAGEENHAEVKGLLGYAEQREKRIEIKYVVVSNIEEARKISDNLNKTGKNFKTALLGQTTISQDEFFHIAEEIKTFFPDLEIINTICDATSERQQALREILPQVDAVIVAGGEESANTRCLFAIAKESGKPAVLVESASDIPNEFFKFETVGLCAGASTPDSVVNDIEKTLAKGF